MSIGKLPPAEQRRRSRLQSCACRREVLLLLCSPVAFVVLTTGVAQGRFFARQEYRARYRHQEPLLEIQVFDLIGGVHILRSDQEGAASSAASHPSSRGSFDRIDPNASTPEVSSLSVVSTTPFRLSHLDPVDPKSLKPKGFAAIDTTHRKGLLHTGGWIVILDTSLSSRRSSKEGGGPHVLLLKRGHQVVTCPDSWSLLGEHAYRDEDPSATVTRGMQEELGLPFARHVSEFGRVRNLTKYPVYYERHYGIENGGRVDRQVTYLWLVECNMSVRNQKTMENQATGHSLKVANSTEKEGVQNIDHHIGRSSSSSSAPSWTTASAGLDQLMRLDDEVAEHAWVNLTTLEAWIHQDEALLSMGKSPRLFCHATIISLVRLVLQRMKAVSEEAAD